MAYILLVQLKINPQDIFVWSIWEWCNLPLMHPFVFKPQSAADQASGALLTTIGLTYCVLVPSCRLLSNYDTFSITWLWIPFLAFWATPWFQVSSFQLWKAGWTRHGTWRLRLPRSLWLMHTTPFWSRFSHRWPPLISLNSVPRNLWVIFKKKIVDMWDTLAWILFTQLGHPRGRFENPLGYDKGVLRKLGL
jgi:hypothetical protein